MADTILVLDREKRTENKATLFCTGRDIESLELGLELDNETHIWKLIGQSEGEQILLADDVILTVKRHLDVFLSDFTGTATKLSTEVEKTTGKIIAPATLRKKLMRNSGELSELGWQCSFRRTRNEKIIEIRRRESAATDSEPYAELMESHFVEGEKERWGLRMPSFRRGKHSVRLYAGHRLLGALPRTPRHTLLLRKQQSSLRSRCVSRAELSSPVCPLHSPRGQERRNENRKGNYLNEK